MQTFGSGDLLAWPHTWLWLCSTLDLSGFCQPGKPGIICVEGTTSNCAAWWTVVRNWNWKRLSLKIIEEKEVDNEVSAHRIFNGFAEIGK